jgi:hypothetical protein
MLYSVCSERLVMEELDYSVLYRWFVGLSLDDRIWDATTCPRIATAARRRHRRGLFAEVVAGQSEEFQAERGRPDAAGYPEKSVGGFSTDRPAATRA